MERYHFGKRPTANQVEEVPPQPRDHLPGFAKGEEIDFVWEIGSSDFPEGTWIHNFIMQESEQQTSLPAR